VVAAGEPAAEQRRSRDVKLLVQEQATEAIQAGYHLDFAPLVLDEVLMFGSCKTLLATDLPCGGVTFESL
jgi:hypothetical protein